MFGSSDQSFYPHSFSTRTGFIPGKEPKTPKIIISREAYKRQWLYVDIAQQEVGWLGTARRLENGDFIIDKVMLFEQQVHATETEISTEGLNQLAMDLLDQGDQGMEDWNNLRFWGHSHVRMGTSPSGTDENTMVRRSYGSSSRSNQNTELFCFQDTGHPWAIRGIFNKDGRAEFTIFLYEEGLKVIDAEWEIEDAPEGTVKPQTDTVVEAIAVEDEADAEAADEAAEDAERRALLTEYAVDPEDAEEEAADPAEAGTPDVAEAAQTGSASEGVGGSRVPVAPVAKTEPARSWSPTYYNPFRRRDARYNVEISPELRAEVMAEFKKKVRGMSWFSSGYSPYRGQEERKLPDTSSAAGQVGQETRQSEVILDGEASGPGMFGRDTGESRVPTYNGGTSGEKPRPYSYQLPPAVAAPVQKEVDWRTCKCDKCKEKRREVETAKRAQEAAEREAYYRRMGVTPPPEPKGFWSTLFGSFFGGSDDRPSRPTPPAQNNWDNRDKK